MRSARILGAAVVLLALIARAQDEVVSTDRAKEHAGKKTTVRGVVVDARFGTGLPGKPTLLSLDKPYGSRVFTVIIWQRDRRKFPVAPEKAFKDKTIRVTGVISLRSGIPQVIVTDPSQIVIEDVISGDRG